MMTKILIFPLVFFLSLFLYTLRKLVMITETLRKPSST
jgi:hypothetical protein